MMDERQITRVQMVVFGIWIITLCVTVAIYLLRVAQQELSVGPALESLSRVMAILTPQVTVMLVFFFGISGEDRRQIITRHAGTVKLALVLSLTYHVVVWICLCVGLLTPIFGDVAESTSSIIQITGYFSALGLAPVAYLFTRQGYTGLAGGAERKREPERPAADERTAIPTP